MKKSDVAWPLRRPSQCRNSYNQKVIAKRWGEEAGSDYVPGARPHSCDLPACVAAHSPGSIHRSWGRIQRWMVRASYIISSLRPPHLPLHLLALVKQRSIQSSQSTTSRGGFAGDVRVVQGGVHDTSAYVPACLQSTPPVVQNRPFSRPPS
jgi:hypothetical protein